MQIDSIYRYESFSKNANKALEEYNDFKQEMMDKYAKKLEEPRQAN